FDPAAFAANGFDEGFAGAAFAADVFAVEAFEAEAFEVGAFLADAFLVEALANSASPFFRHDCASRSYFMVIMLSDTRAKVQLARAWAGGDIVGRAVLTYSRAAAFRGIHPPGEFLGSTFLEGTNDI